MDLHTYTSVQPRAGSPSPWDRIDETYPVVPGIVVVSTPGHGGIWISREWICQLPTEVMDWCVSQRNRRGCYTHGPQWFEEDCAWSIPFAFLPASLLRASGANGGLQSGPERALEKRIAEAPAFVRRWFPDLAALLPAAPAVAPTLVDACRAALTLLQDPDAEPSDADRVTGLLTAALAARVQA
jgi:hypothetical protein